MNPAANFINNFSKAAKADPKKTGSLAVLFAVLLVMVGRLVLNGKATAPGSANAMPVPSFYNGVSTADASGNSSDASNHSGTAAAFQKWVEAPVPPISRNLFAVRIDYFPLDGSRTVQSESTDEGFWTKLEKSINQRTDERQRHENMIASFTVDAEKLRLQSVMMGPVPKAMIDGKLVGEGSVVADFRVLKIETRKVIVEREGIMLAIQMK
ncbi:MAG TPA: hypothetical protein VHD56_06150 [Tepidisphaeraceae bacterium]|nr:hypothetical protein [Tepidisphaeraceae bacterium]